MSDFAHKNFEEYTAADFVRHIDELSASVAEDPLSSANILTEIREYLLNTSPGVFENKKKYCKSLADATFSLATAHIRVGNYHNGISLGSESISLYKKVGYNLGVGRALTNIGISYATIGEYEKALNSFIESQQIFSRLGEDNRVALCNINCGNVYSSLGDFARALEYYEQGLNHYRKNENKSGMSDALVNVGLIFQQLGEYPQALLHYEQTLALKEELNDKYGKGRVLQNIGTVHLALGNYAEAFKVFSVAMDVFVELADKYGVGMSHVNVGSVYLKFGEYARALESFHFALKLQEEISDKVGAARTCGFLGSVYGKLQEYEKATEFFESGIKKHTEVKDYSGLAQTLMGLGEVYREQNQFESAVECFTSGLGYMKKLGNKFGAARVIGNLGWIYSFYGNIENSISLFSECLHIQKTVGDKEGESESWLYLSEVAENSPEKVKSISGEFKMADNVQLPILILKKSLKIAEEIASINLQVKIHSALGLAFEKRSQFDDALFHVKKMSEIRQKILNIESSQRIAFYSAIFELEKIQRETELYRLKNVELVQLNREISEQRNLLAEQASHIQKTNSELRQKNSILRKLIDEKNAVLGLVAHDLKSPISGVRMIGEYMCSASFEPSKHLVLELGHDIRTSSSLMFDTISNLLEVKNLEESPTIIQLSEFDVVEAVQSVASRYSERMIRKNIILDINSCERIVMIASDNTAVVKVLDCLISNAVKFTKLSGAITVSIDKKESMPSKKGRSIKKKSISISVRDSGQGIKIEEQKHLYKKFTKLSARPTGGEHSAGLGLWIAKTLTDKIHGVLVCKSTYGNGSEFTLLLPEHLTIYR